MEERRHFPNLNDFVAALPTVTQRQPQEQAESIHRPLPSLAGYPVPPVASGHWAPHVSGSSATAASLRDPGPPASQHALGHSDLPVSVPVHGFPSASVPQLAPVRQDPLMPPPQPVSGPAVVAPRHALGHSDLPVSVPVHGFPSAPSHPIPPESNQLDSALANPTLPYPVPISQPTMDDPSLQRPAPAAPGNGGPLPSGQNNSSTDAYSRQVHGPANPRHFTGQDITDHGPNNGIRTSVQEESSLRLQLTVGGSFLDPEKYEPVKFLASGGFAKVIMHILLPIESIMFSQHAVFLKLFNPII